VWILRRRAGRLELLAPPWHAKVCELRSRTAGAAVSETMFTVHIKRNWTSRSPRLLALLCKPRALCVVRSIKVSTRHLPPVLNLWVDRLSRRLDRTAWDLSLTSTLLPTRLLREKPLDGKGISPPGDCRLGAPSLAVPRPTRLQVWHRHLPRLRRGYLVSPVQTGL
jgi:hypothetical protein